MLSQAYKYQKQQTKAQKNTDKFLEKIKDNLRSVLPTPISANLTN